MKWFLSLVVCAMFASVAVAEDGSSMAGGGTFSHAGELYEFESWVAWVAVVNVPENVNDQPSEYEVMICTAFGPIFVYYDDVTNGGQINTGYCLNSGGAYAIVTADRNGNGIFGDRPFQGESPLNDVSILIPLGEPE